MGYKTPEEAAKAVKRMNKSFIRMSRLRVELAQSASREVRGFYEDSSAEHHIDYLMSVIVCREPSWGPTQGKAETGTQ